MKNILLFTIGLILAFVLGYYTNSLTSKKEEIVNEQSNITTKNDKEEVSTLGAFSISLSVKDLKRSKAFYENLGFKEFGGGMDQNYLIMKNGNALIGIFQGMFEGNILTFNPGWDQEAKNIEEFEDIRSIQKSLKNKNIPLTSEADEKTSGPASIMLADPDGNVILLDQHR